MIITFIGKHYAVKAFLIYTPAEHLKAYHQKECKLKQTRLYEEFHQDNNLPL